MNMEQNEFKSKSLTNFKIIFVITFTFILSLAIYLMITENYIIGYSKHGRNNEVQLSGKMLLFLDFMLLVFYYYSMVLNKENILKK
jgi:hypothetical protein